jgi:four helix bundle protein
MVCALTHSMKAKKLDDVLVYKKSIAGANAVSALLARPAFRRDFKLRDQLSQSSSRTSALIAEGFGQLTDRHTASYYANARGSALETIAHLEIAQGRDHISDDERAPLAGMYVEIVKMLTSWINYLDDCDWKKRS